MNEKEDKLTPKDLVEGLAIINDYAREDGMYLSEVAFKKIVRAVNNHDVLVKVLENAVRVFNVYGTANMQLAADECRDALAKARE